MNTQDILIVNNDADYLNLLRLFLKMEGFNVIMARCGMEALEMLNKHNIRLLLTDLQIPDMNGIELAIKAREHHEDIIVFLMTDSLMPVIRETATCVGVFTVFTKPLNLRELLVTINASLY